VVDDDDAFSPLRGGDRLPPLEHGDRLSRQVFERRYAAMPTDTQAELIEGIVYMASPVHARHGSFHARMMGWLSIYCTATPSVTLYDNATVRLEPESEVQPDALVCIDAAAGGQSRISEDDYLEGAPELVVEVALSSASYDMHDKLRLYSRNGVQEYVVWQVHDNRLEWFRLEGGSYVPVPPDDDGLIRSRVLPGLHLAHMSLLEGDMATVLEVARQGTTTDEHATFVTRLRDCR
jgi:Uma2 family endonuclease